MVVADASVFEGTADVVSFGVVVALEGSFFVVAGVAVGVTVEVAAGFIAGVGVSFFVAVSVTFGVVVVYRVSVGFSVTVSAFFVPVVSPLPGTTARIMLIKIVHIHFFFIAVFSSHTLKCSMGVIS